MKGMNKLKEMIKRRKDEGFTLIELMRVVEGYVQSRITSWVDTKTAAADVASDIYTQFDTIADLEVDPYPNAAIKNPFTGKVTVSSSNVAPVATDAGVLHVIKLEGVIDDADVSDLQGLIVVVPIGNPVISVKIYAHDNLGKVMADKTIIINS